MHSVSFGTQLQLFISHKYHSHKKKKKSFCVQVHLALLPAYNASFVCLSVLVKSKMTFSKTSQLNMERAQASGRL